MQESDCASDYGDPAVFFKWKCAICLCYAIDGLKLEEQHLEAQFVALFDADNSIWIRCDDCFNSAHVKCLTSVLEIPDMDAAQINSKGRFICGKHQTK